MAQQDSPSGGGQNPTSRKLPSYPKLNKDPQSLLEPRCNDPDPLVISIPTLNKSHAGTPLSVPAHHMSPTALRGTGRPGTTCPHQLPALALSLAETRHHSSTLTKPAAPHTGLGLHDSSCRRLPEREWPGDEAVRCLKAGCLQEAAGTVVALLVFRDSLPAYS